MKFKAVFACLAFAGAGNVALTDAHADPANVRAYCATHRNYSGPGEEARETLPVDVRRAGATYWRCMDGQVMICNGGANGFACLRSERIDARRRQAFSSFCSQNPGSDFIPAALTAGLSSSWRCQGTVPAPINSRPVDRLGYQKGSWRILR